MEEEKEVTLKTLVDGREVPIIGVCMEIGGVLNERHKFTDNIHHMSRQITWESKRAISATLGHINNPAGLKTVEDQLNRMLRMDKFWTGLCKELYTEDKNYYYRCYIAALQEYVEAYALLIYIKYGRIITYPEIREKFAISFKRDPLLKDQCETYQIPITKTDFYLGLADVTGELVRACAARVHNKDLKKFLFDSCLYVRAMFICFSRMVTFPRELLSKLNVMRGSLCKLEMLCYHSAIRGDRLSIMFSNVRSGMYVPPEDEDSGYD